MLMLRVDNMNQCADYVVSHELKEAGVHIMICSGSYLDPSGEEKKVRQYFKFQVQKPLSVTTKLHLLNNTILLENQIQNQTKTALAIDVIKFEPTPHYLCQDFTQPTADSSGGAEEADLSEGIVLDGSTRIMRAGDVRQFVYCLVPRSGVLNPSDTASFDLGRLEMAWRTTLGEPGRLHSLVNMQQWKVPAHQDVVVTPARVPEHVEIERPFSIELRVLNNSTAPRTLALVVDLDLHGAVVQCGGSAGQAIGILAPGALHTVTAHLIALQQGLLQISPSQVCVVEVDAKTGSKQKHQLAHTLHLLVRPAASVVALKSLN